MIKLALLDGDIYKYLLYLLLFMQFVMGKPVTLLDTLLTKTESNENWAK